MKRLTILVAAAALAAGTLTGCGAATTELTVLGPWSGGEADSFHAMIADFESAHHVRIDYIGTAAVNQVLQADVQKGQPPDVAVVSSPGELVRYAADGQLRRIPALDPDEYSQQWRALMKLGTPDTYAVPVKADLKSIVWYDPRTTPALPEWPQLLAATAKGAKWCLGVEAYSTSGWPGTDWIEDILLHTAGPQVYQDWARGRLLWDSDQMKAAWTTWGQLLAAQGAQSAQATRSAALLTYFGDASKQMFAQDPGRRCQLEHQGSFAPGSYPDGSAYDFFAFPSLDPNVRQQPYEVSVNPAGLFTDNPLAGELMSYLAGEPAQKVWPEQQASSGFSVDSKVIADNVYQTPVRRKIAQVLTERSLCLDASDVMPADMSEAFSRAVLEYLADPGRLDEILAGLDQVRIGLGDRPTLSACG